MTPEQILANLHELDITVMVTDSDHLVTWPADRLPDWLFVEMLLAKPALKRLVRGVGVRVEPSSELES